MTLTYDFSSAVYGETRTESVTLAEGLQKLRELVNTLGLEWRDENSVVGMDIREYRDWCGVERVAKGLMTVTLK